MISEDFDGILRYLRSNGTKIGPKLGKGGFGFVYQGHIETGSINIDVAIKLVPKEDDDKKVSRELKICSSIEHPNIVTYYDCRDYSKNAHDSFPFVVYVMELAATTLSRKIKDLKEQGIPVVPEKDSKFWFRQVIEGLHYLDKKRICHRDLKEDNILLDAYGNAKLADFGLARYFHVADECDSDCGTRAYKALEIGKKNYNGRCGDVWSLGVIIFVAAVGRFPFSDDATKARKQKEGHIIYYPKGSQASASLRRVVDRCLQPMPSARPTYAALIQMEYFRGICPTLRGPE